MQNFVFDSTQDMNRCHDCENDENDEAVAAQCNRSCPLCCVAFGICHTRVALDANDGQTQVLGNQSPPCAEEEALCRAERALEDMRADMDRRVDQGVTERLGEERRALLVQQSLQTERNRASEELVQSLHSQITRLKEELETPPPRAPPCPPNDAVHPQENSSQHETGHKEVDEEPTCIVLKPDGTALQRRLAAFVREEVSLLLAHDKGLSHLADRVFVEHDEGHFKADVRIRLDDRWIVFLEAKETSSASTRHRVTIPYASGMAKLNRDSQKHGVTHKILVTSRASVATARPRQVVHGPGVFTDPDGCLLVVRMDEMDPVQWSLAVSRMRGVIGSALQVSLSAPCEMSGQTIQEVKNGVLKHAREMCASLANVRLLFERMQGNLCDFDGMVRQACRVMLKDPDPPDPMDRKKRVR